MILKRRIVICIILCHVTRLFCVGLRTRKNNYTNVRVIKLRLNIKYLPTLQHVQRTVEHLWLINVIPRNFYLLSWQNILTIPLNKAPRFNKHNVAICFIVWNYAKMTCLKAVNPIKTIKLLIATNMFNYYHLTQTFVSKITSAN